MHGLVRTEDLGGPLPDGRRRCTTVDLDPTRRCSRELVARVGPDEIYNLGGLSSVARSWEEPGSPPGSTALAALT